MTTNLSTSSIPAPVLVVTPVTVTMLLQDIDYSISGYLRELTQEELDAVGVTVEWVAVAAKLRVALEGE